MATAGLAGAPSLFASPRCSASPSVCAVLTPQSAGLGLLTCLFLLSVGYITFLLASLVPGYFLMSAQFRRVLCFRGSLSFRLLLWFFPRLLFLEDLFPMSAVASLLTSRVCSVGDYSHFILLTPLPTPVASSPRELSLPSDGLAAFPVLGGLLVTFLFAVTR